MPKAHDKSTIKLHSFDPPSFIFLHYIFARLSVTKKVENIYTTVCARKKKKKKRDKLSENYYNRCDGKNSPLLLSIGTYVVDKYFYYVI